MCAYNKRDLGQQATTEAAEQPRQQIVEALVHTDFSLNTAISDLFEEQVVSSPDSIALLFDNQAVTYQQLNAMANRLAHQIREYFQHHQQKQHQAGEAVLVEQLVGLYFDRSIEMVVAILAVLKAGCAYVPIAPSYPDDRKVFIVKDAELTLVLTQGHLVSELEQLEVAPSQLSIVAADDKTMTRQYSVSNVAAEISVQALGYVIYTSGTTGQPKGVMIEQQSVVNLIASQTAAFQFDHTEVVLWLPAYIFDASVEPLFLALLNGARLVIPTEEESRLPCRLVNHLAENGITHLVATPSHLLLLGDVEYKEKVKRVVFGGEDCPPALRAIWQQKLVNEYGPTEATVTTTVCTDYYFQENGQCIGSPIANAHCYVLDDSLNPVEPGQLGELYIAGLGLARGYLNRPELTEERFISLPWSADSGSGHGSTRAYRTGDLVTETVDGALIFHGRNDFQVKIRGHRIELGEIEHALARLPHVSQAVVIDREWAGSKYLAAYVVVAKGAKISNQTLRQALVAVLPDYMVPASFTQIDSVPLTLNGKLDRKALPELALVDEERYAPPENPLQATLCEIWQSLLGVSQVGVNDNFFRIGGDSILSIQLVARLRQEGYRLQVDAIVNAPTVAELDAFLANEVSSCTTSIIAEQGLLEGRFGLLPTQQWFFNTPLAAPHYWNQSFVIRIPGHIEFEMLDQAVRQLVQQHDILRCRFIRTGVEVEQCYHTSSATSPLVSLNVDGLVASQLTAQLTDLQTPLDLEEGPLWRAAHLVGYQDGSARLWFTAHHLIMDVVSWRIIADELKRLLTGEKLIGDPPQHAEQSLLQVVDKGSSYRQWVDAVARFGEANRQQRSYWQTILDTQPEWPKPGKTSRHRVRLNAHQADVLLQQANAGYHTEINDLLLSALAIALSEVLGGDKFTVTLEGHGRENIDPSLDISRTLGWFTSIYPLQLAVSDDTEQTITGIKESLRKVPDKGMAFGPLYHADQLQGKLPPVGFNYLGQLGEQNDTEDWQLVDEPVGHFNSPENGDDLLLIGEGNGDYLLLNLTGAVRQGQLSFDVTSRLSELHSRQFVTAFETALWTVAKQGQQAAATGGITTASDHPGVSISQQQLTALHRRFAVEALFPASSLQQGFVYHHLRQPDDDAYRVQLLLDYQCELNIDLYQRAWSLASRRYPALRTGFDWQAELLQIVCSEASLGTSDFTILDLSELDSLSRQQQLAELLRRDRQNSFDLSRPGLLRFHIIKCGQDRYQVLKTAHHSILDGWSGPLLLAQVHHYYDQLKSGLVPRVKAEPAYLEAQRYLQQQRDHAKAYWQTQLDRFQSSNDINGLLSTPIDLDNPPSHGHPVEYTLALVGESYLNLKAMCREQGVTVNVALQFAWHKLLHSYTLDEQTIVGTTVSGRDLPVAGIETSVGLYINTLPLAVDWPDEASIAEVLIAIQKTIAGINSHSGIALASLQQQGERLFHSLFDFEHYPPLPDDDEAGLGANMQVVDVNEKVDYPLSLLVTEQGEQLTLKLCSTEQLLQQDKAHRLLAQLDAILREVSEYPDRPHRAISLLDSSEHKRLVETLNSNEAWFGQSQTLSQLFEQQVAKTPASIALVFEQTRLNYAELCKRVEHRCGWLQQAYLSQHGKPLLPGAMIALYLDRGLDTVISILAVLKAGAAYVPISPSHPDERVGFILTDTRAPILLTQHHYHQRLSEVAEGLAAKLTSPPLVLAIDKQPAQTVTTTELPQADCSAADLAYVIYTSGTTGQPKGVMIEHRSVANLIGGQTRLLNFDHSDVVLWLPAYIFDASVEPLFLALLNGGTLVIPAEEALNQPDRLRAMVKAEGVTQLVATPSHLLALGDLSEQEQIKRVIFGGEPCPPELAELWRDKLINEYGPTETTVTATVCVDYYQRQQPKCIGHALPNVKLYVLNDSLNPVPVGVPGELFIGGVGVARGYLNRPDLNSERFLDDPFADEIALDQGLARIYRTGDWVKWTVDGRLEYLGRRDQQVKIRGHRIELGEVTHALSQQPSIGQAVVIDRQRDGKAYLAAYFVASSGYKIEHESLKRYLAERLPDYMVPATFTQLESIPLTINGKLDKHALPEPMWLSASRYLAPRSALEASLAEHWQLVLGLERVGVEDNFFSIGGDSIVSIQLVSRLRKAGMDVQVKTIFDAPTIVQLAEALQTSSTASVIEAEQGELCGEFELLPIQQWFFDQQYSKPNHWNQAFMLTLPQGVGLQQLEDVLTSLSQHHDMLRCRFVLSAQGIRQGYLPWGDSIQVEVFRHNGDEALMEQYFSEWQSHFDYVNGPLWRAVLLEMTDGQPKRLFLAFHHLIIDTVSWRILAEDITGLLSGETLAEKSSSYRQWVAAIGDYANSHRQELGYWQQTIAECQSFAVFPQAHASQLKPPHREAAHREVLRLSSATTRNLLHSANQGYHSEINDLLLSGLAIALASTFGRSVNAVTLEGHGREVIDERLDLSRTVGWFTSQYPILLRDCEDLGETIIATKEMLRAVPTKGLGYGALLKSGALDDAPLPVIGFNYLGQFGGEDQAGQQGSGQIIATGCGQTMAAENHDNLLLNINGAVLEGQLVFGIDSRLALDQTQGLVTAFDKALHGIVAQAQIMADASGVMTASDYRVDGLSQQRLRSLEQRYAVEAIFPANSLQQGFIAHHLRYPDDDAYRVQLVLDYPSKINIDKYIEAWRLAAIRFPILRTAFDWQGSIIQIVDAHSSIDRDNFTVIDLSALNTPVREVEIQAIIEQQRRLEFELDRPGLIRFALVKQSEQLFTLIKTEHHSIADGWSGPVLLQWVHDAYDHLCGNQPLQVEAETTYLDAQRYLQSQQRACEAYWQQQGLEQAEANDLNWMLTRPLDLSRPAENDAPRSETLLLQGQSYQELKTLCKTQGVTMNAALQFAWHKLLHIYCRDERTIVGTTVSGRDIPVEGIATSVGLYINTLPLTVEWQSESSVAALMQQIQRHVAALNSYSGVSLSTLQNEGERLFHSLFVFENYPTTADAANGSVAAGLSVRAVIEKNDYPLALAVYEGEQALTLKLNYGAAWLDDADAQRLLSQLTMLLQQMSEQPDVSHQLLTVMAPTERQQVLELWNATDVDYPVDQTVLQLVERSVGAEPNKQAIRYGDQDLSYQQLDAWATQLAAQINATVGEVGRDTLIGLCFDRGIEMIVAMLATWKLGAGYLPLAPEQPDERCAFILEDAAVAVVISQARYQQRLELLCRGQTDPATVIVVDAAPSSEHDVEPVDIQTLAESENAVDPYEPFKQHSCQKSRQLAYAIYTSGTTGTPKGVLIEHRSVVNLCHYLIDSHGLSADSKVLFFSNYVFDASIFELFPALAAGAEVVIAPEQARVDINALVALLKGEAISHAFIPTVLVNQYSELLAQAGVGLIHTGGDSLSPLPQLPGKQLLNEYGPTETTVCVTQARICAGKPISIGRAIANTRLYVLDRLRQPVPVGVPGELYVGGLPLARGYINRPELNAARFVTNPFASEAERQTGDDRLYSTGDLVRWRADGELEYLGRNDLQVKIRGYRIELSEIEAVLNTWPEVEQTVVVDFKRHGQSALAAYLVLSHNKTLSSTECRQRLALSLPEYMLPDAFTFLTQLPLTLSGKLDRRALPEPVVESVEVYVAPSTELEAQIATVWRQVLQVERVGITDNFFHLGGNSINAVQAVADINTALDIHPGLAVRDLFEALTIGNLIPIAQAAIESNNVEQQVNEMSI
ncbi:amino acid adenylation domain-containing protein [Motilimonas cestriensis]|uniref:amino acid adenylation domain-containing protein n=1 Tax=Motilimonas cestriensis TaxID=2742685 RepID=UPI003DA63868